MIHLGTFLLVFTIGLSLVCSYKNLSTHGSLSETIVQRGSTLVTLSCGIKVKMETSTNTENITDNGDPGISMYVYNPYFDGVDEIYSGMENHVLITSRNSLSSLKWYDIKVIIYPASNISQSLEASCNDMTWPLLFIYTVMGDSSTCSTFIFQYSLIGNTDRIRNFTKKVCQAPGCHRYIKVETMVTVKSPNFPEYYPDKYNCTYILYSEQNSNIRLQTFLLEKAYDGECYDYITIATEGQISQKLCGHITDNDLAVLFFSTTTNTMKIQFVTDSKLVNSGFTSTAYSIKDYDCNVTKYSEESLVRSPFYPSKYPPSLTCNINLRLPDDYLIQLDVLFMQLEKSDQHCQNDFLLISSMLSNGSQIRHGRYCKLQKEYQSIQSSSNNVVITFSFNYVQEGHGFELRYKGIRPCRNISDDSSNGSLTSINFPSNYLNSQICYFTLGSFSDSYAIKIDFEEFHLESGGNDVFLQDHLCRLDFVQIFMDNKTVKICGLWKTRERKLSFQAKSGPIRILFKTNAEVTRPGFYARWKSIPKDSYMFRCPNVMIESEDYDLEYVQVGKSWQEGQMDCVSRGGNLVTVADSNMQHIIETYLKSNVTCSTDYTAYWIGGSDIAREGDFHWTDGTHVIYTNWFHGWSNMQFSSQQPSDDGFANEDCIEIRNTFTFHTSGLKKLDSYFWNDRNCKEENPYICQHFKKNVQPNEDFPCDVILHLNSSHSSAIMRSPNYPGNYSESLRCNYTVYAPIYHAITVDFLAFDIEDSVDCHHDNLSLSSFPDDSISDIYCGNWTYKRKLLRWQSVTNFAYLIFTTDKSVSSSGFEFNISLSEYNSHCVFYGNPDNTTCTVTTSGTQKTFQDAHMFCSRFNAVLTSLASHEDVFNFLSHNFVSYKRVVWHNAGIRKDNSCPIQILHSVGRCPIFNYTLKNNVSHCSEKHYFFCRKLKSEELQTESIIMTGRNGIIQYPNDQRKNYGSHDNKAFRIVTLPSLRIHIQITKLDIEYQQQCLYDVLNISDLIGDHTFCGTLDDNSTKHAFSTTNVVNIHFTSDYSVTGKGFEIHWTVFNPSICIVKQHSDGENIVRSFRFHANYSVRGSCCEQIKNENSMQPTRLLLRLRGLHLYSVTSCLMISDDVSVAYMACGITLNATQKTFLSNRNYFNVCFNFSSLKIDEGFEGTYQSVPSEFPTIREEILLLPGTNDSSTITNINYPNTAPANHRHIIKLRTIPGYRIFLTFPKIDLMHCHTCEHSYLEVLDDSLSNRVIWNTTWTHITNSCGPFHSFLNRLTLVFVHPTNLNPLIFIGRCEIVKDVNILNNTIQISGHVMLDNCEQEKTCLNGGNCTETSHGEFTCTCPTGFIGLFCQATWCEVNCPNGLCIDTESGHACSCEGNLWGLHCNLTHAQCRKSFCSSTGSCYGNSKWKPMCNCDSGWLGKTCSEQQVMPKPDMTTVTEKLLKEPIWVGMIVMLNLLFIFGILYFAKKKCGRHIKCCQDTKEILRSREDGIPAHCNDHSPHSPTVSEDSLKQITTPSLTTLTEINGNMELEVKDDLPPAILNPSMNVKNQKAAARLFASYKSTSTHSGDEEQCKQTSNDNNAFGLVDGTLVLSQSPAKSETGHLVLHSTSDSPNNRNLRQIHSASSAELGWTARKTTRILKSHSASAVSSNANGIHALPKLVFENGDRSLHNKNTLSEYVEKDGEMRNIHKTYAKNIRLFHSLEASDKRRVFARKCKSHNSNMKMSSLTPNLSSTLQKDDSDYCVDTARCETSSNSLNYHKCASSQTLVGSTEKKYLKNRKSNTFSSSELSILQSFSNSSDDARSRTYSESRLDKRGKHHKRYHCKVTRKRGHSNKLSQQRWFSEERLSKKPSDRKRRNTCIQANNLEISKSLDNLQDFCDGGNGLIKCPIRKCKSNDLNFIRVGREHQLKLNKNQQKRSLRHSFHSRKDLEIHEQNPDEMLNIEQTQKYRDWLKNNDNLHIVLKGASDDSAEKYNGRPFNVFHQSLIDSNISSVFVSMNDTDTGFSSSTKSFISTPKRYINSDPMESCFIDDCNKLSSISYVKKYLKHQGSCENRALAKRSTETRKPRDEDRKIYTQLQQVALKLFMYNKHRMGNDSLSKDSAFHTISEDELLNSVDSDFPTREQQSKGMSTSGWFNRTLALEQVSEENDLHSTSDSNKLSLHVSPQDRNIDTDKEEAIVVCDDFHTYDLSLEQSSLPAEEIEMSTIGTADV